MKYAKAGQAVVGVAPNRLITALLIWAKAINHLGHNLTFWRIYGVAFCPSGPSK